MNFALLLLLSAAAPAPVALQNSVQDKNFYLLSLIESTPSVKKAVAEDPVLSHLRPGYQITSAESAEAARALSALYQKSPAVRAMADGPLRTSGMYIRYDNLPGGELLERALSECIRGINRIVDVYALGKPPRYPAIDSVTYDPKTPAYQQVLKSFDAIIQEDAASLDLFFSKPLRYALELLWLNHRDEAGREEPMERKDNSAAFQRVKSVDWSKFPYTVIVVPGAGNDRPGVRLSPSGKLRDEIAAKRYREGKAPFILVSGGYVHPSQTEYAEAIEMKRDLMERFHIPADAIIIDPHARHTTTNMRNAARLMYRYGIPFDRKALVTTDPSQSQYISDPTFEKRCIEELGYLPHRLLTRLSTFDIEFLPKIESLHADPLDPLDP
jgi:hypothetical protein